ncbi:unnamed protein product [Urochloa humidicola]
MDRSFLSISASTRNLKSRLLLAPTALANLFKIRLLWELQGQRQQCNSRFRRSIPMYVSQMKNRLRITRSY